MKRIEMKLARKLSVYSTE